MKVQFINDLRFEEPGPVVVRFTNKKARPIRGHAAKENPIARLLRR